MSVPTFIPFLDPYKVYAQAGGIAQPNATTMQQMQNLFGNWSDMLATFVKCLWQPSKAYVINQIVWSPSMPANTVAICTKAGTSGSSEPSWPRLVNGTASDGGATWKLIEAHPQTLPANGGTADVAENAKKLGGQLPAYYATAANLNLKAPIANPNFTGVPKGPTAAPGTNTTQLATTAFVTTALSSLTGQGKIVAYNLAQNGYVKWDIGLILQWGLTANGELSQTVKLNIAMRDTRYCILPTLGKLTQGDITYVALQCGPKNNAEFTITSTNGGSGTVFWFVIG